MNQTDRLIKKIVIVGGGTAGWLSAAYLNQALNDAGRAQLCEIVLIEASDINPIGVGEATIPTLLNTCQFLGLSEYDWMVKCNATFKLGIKFAKWLNGKESDFYWHTFGKSFYPYGDRLPLYHRIIQQLNLGHPESFARSCFEAVRVSEAQKSPKFNNGPEYQKQIEYAYHLDAGLFAQHLKQLAKRNGVKQIIDKVTQVKQDEKGFITSVITENHREIAGELFSDCSGFRGLLINQALKEPFVSYSDNLLCDRAIAISTPYAPGDSFNQTNGGINPYTTATGLSNGWVWHTPLVERSGNGYVYSSNHLDPETAEIELRNHLGIGEDLTARHIKMRVGRTRNVWVNNCLSIGLSSGFIEPLESTGIYLIETALQHLVHGFPDRSFNPLLIKQYNRVMREQYEEIRDFIVFHYCLTRRNDTQFWLDVQSPATIPPAFQEQLELWQHQLPHSGKSMRRIFDDYSYVSILAGMDRLPKNNLHILDYQNPHISKNYLREITDRGKQLAQNLPTHGNYLQNIHSKYGDRSNHLGIRSPVVV